ncbi:hypothetical protein Pcinc_035463 [Petrolisthes cinctipes]|uniref:Ig-like domain-containing protein n=1 Tax=Petrolisthes cinctipes TaxID=88211 RepID=A0AAE1BWR6_PETCI|nr:hypothetical protein Pcinc_035463 [Petrolisthes cinctipes]
MGAYLCIASNGVPPSVSKRITLDVEFPPQIHVPNQLVGVPTGDNVTIECFVEAFPKAISYWVGKGMMILNSDKYRSETYETLYRIHMKLTVFNFSRDDNTTYKCVAKNSLGETEGDIKLNEIYIPPKATEIRSNTKHEEDGVGAPDVEVAAPPRHDPAPAPPTDRIHRPPPPPPTTHGEPQRLGKQRDIGDQSHYHESFIVIIETKAQIKTEMSGPDVSVGGISASAASPSSSSLQASTLLLPILLLLLLVNSNSSSFSSCSCFSFLLLLLRQ